MKEAILIPGFFEKRLLTLLQFQVNLLKESGISLDTEKFHRKQFHNHPLFVALHNQMAEEASLIFGEELKPSYSFLSMYLRGMGDCPIHTDRPPCYRTIDVCINQEKPWPLYVNEKMAWDPEAVEEIKRTSREFMLLPGDAVLYSGTDHPHFRKPMKDIHGQENNFVDMAFFHFVPVGFEGDLK